MATLIGLSGSVRKSSFNTSLLRAAADLMPAGSSMAVHTIQRIPIYDADLEASQGLPQAVTELKEAIIAADGVILATPEYNNSMPGAAKNAIDWLSRPPADIPRVFGNKPFAVIGATPGGFGTILSQNAWLPVLRHLGAKTWFGGRLLVSQATTAFDAEGRLADDKVRQQLETFLKGFVESLG